MKLRNIKEKRLGKMVTYPSIITKGFYRVNDAIFYGQPLIKKKGKRK